VKKFWKAVAHGFTMAALWAAEHPDQVAAIVSVAQKAAK
jgi:hypothetical protein